MPFAKEFDLFEFTDLVLEKFRKESHLQLDGYEFEYRIRRDWNCPVKRINIRFYIYGQEFSTTIFDEKYNTAEEALRLLLVHLRDDAGYDDLRECLVAAKRYSLEERLAGLTKRIEDLARGRREAEKLIVMVDEKYPYETFHYENGFPIFQYQIYTMDEKVKLYTDLDFNLKGFDDEQLLERIEILLAND